MTILAIDYGTQRLGLAISRVNFAEPLCIILNSENMFEELQKIINDESVEKIVIGISEQLMAEKTRKFADDLANITSLPIEFTDETLSSKTVHEKLINHKKKTRSGHIDHFAAAEFLQEWLELNPSE